MVAPDDRTSGLGCREGLVAHWLVSFIWRENKYLGWNESQKERCEVSGRELGWDVQRAYVVYRDRKASGWDGSLWQTDTVYKSLEKVECEEARPCYEIPRCAQADKGFGKWPTRDVQRCTGSDVIDWSAHGCQWFVSQKGIADGYIDEYIACCRQLSDNSV